MTLKTRNKLNIALFIFSLCFLALNVIILLFSIYNKSFSIDFFTGATENFGQKNKVGSFLTAYSPLVVLISLYFQIIYVCTTSYMLYRVFEKTQATDISFFFLFLIALIANSLRIWILLFNMNETFSGLLLFCGNAILFSKLLIPTSVFFSVVMSGVDQRQNLEKNIFILLLGSIFFAQIIPLNTAKACLNYEIDYSYRSVINVTSTLVVLASLAALFYNNHQKLYTQFTTIGLFLICSGTFILLNSTNLLKLITSFVFLFAGNLLYLKELHKQYLWNDA
jgi:hypothetical protein